MKNTALITGASNGIGLELAMVHAATGGDLVLVARNAQKLQELKNKIESLYKVQVLILVMDLSKPGSASELYEETKKHGVQIHSLINNAGFGDFGLFHQSNWKKTEEMIQLNITTLTHLCHLFAADMVKAKSGRIMNVASTAAFQSGPTMAVYYATKAYVLSFSEAIHNELSEYGVTVTALCPGATTSGFQEAAAMQESKLVKGKKLPSSEEVAVYGYKAMLKGKPVAIHGTMNAIMANAVRFIPRAWAVKIVRSIQDKS